MSILSILPIPVNTARAVNTVNSANTCQYRSHPRRQKGGFRLFPVSGYKNEGTKACGFAPKQKEEEEEEEEEEEKEEEEEE